jgi:hypothetical protein
MKRFRVEKEDGSKLIVTLYKPPYEDENILHKLGGWNKKDVTITEIKQYREIEE